MSRFTLRFRTPFGVSFEAVCENDAYASSEWVAPQRGDRLPRSGPDGSLLENQLARYFAGSLPRFSVPLDLRGSDFVLRIWQATCEIPFGKTASYGDVARAAGHPGAHRGAARAMSLLGFALLVPAHRVIGADGRIKGEGPGSMRRVLYEFERRNAKTGKKTST